MIDIGLAGALLGGVLSLLSPCSVMLLPAFFATAFADPRTLVVRAGLFTAGLMTTLVPLGLFAGAVGALLLQHRAALIAGASVLLVVLGLVQLLGVPLPAFARAAPGGADARGGADASGSASGAAMFLLGAVYAVAGVCSGPILGSVLTVAATGGSALYGGLLLGVYALGMAVPLLVLSLLWKPLGPRLRRWLRPRELVIGRWRNSWAMIASGLVAIAFGVLLWTTNGTADLFGLVSIGDQQRIEMGALRATEGVGDVVVVLVVAALAIVAVLVAARMRGRRTAPSSSDRESRRRLPGECSSGSRGSEP